MPGLYDEPDNPALPPASFQFDLARTALVRTDPHIDFLSPGGVSWGVSGDSSTREGTVKHIGQLLAAAKDAGLTVAVSPHYYYPSDHQWRSGGPLEVFRHQVNMFGRAGALTPDGYAGSGAGFLPAYQPSPVLA